MAFSSLLTVKTFASSADCWNSPTHWENWRRSSEDFTLFAFNCISFWDQQEELSESHAGVFERRRADPQRSNALPGTAGLKTATDAAAAALQTIWGLSQPTIFQVYVF